MSALAHRLPREFVPARPHLHLLPAPVSSQGVPQRVFRRRRVVAALVASVVLLAAASFVDSGLSWAWERVTDSPVAPVVATAAPESRQAQEIKEWTVRPGDTIWGIAKSIQPQGDIRPLVSKLMKTYKDRPLQVGEKIAIPQ